MTTSKILKLTAVGLILCVLIIAVIHYSLREPRPSLGPKRTVPYDFPGSFYLKTLPIPATVRDHLLDGDFKIARQQSEIPTTCKLGFQSSFTTISGSRAKPEEVTLADPGQPFQASDNVVSGLPFRRLVFSGFSVDRCFMYYESGGGPPSFCLAIVGYTKHVVIWAGESHVAAHDADELRRMFLDHALEDDLGRGC